MSGDHVFYKQAHNYMPAKYWKRYLLCGAILTIGCSVGYFVEQKCYQRFSQFRGKTALYGRQPYEGGTWKKDQSS